MREVLKEDGTKAITTNDEPKGKKVFPVDGVISTNNIEAVKRQRAEEAAAAKGAENEKA